ncbi:MAG: translocation/assembly module TamB domain-containing protein [Pseudomonadota bacterium]
MRVLTVVLLLLVPLAAAAQNTRLEALLENQLSSDDRTVEIDGFAGALTAQATMDAMRFSDREGVWLELTDIVLDWNRGALFRGRLEVTQLTAARIAFERSPISEGPDLPSSESSGFRIPDLPVTIQIDRLAVDQISLGPAVLGEPLTAKAELSAVLRDGGLDLTLLAERTDAKAGTANIALAFSPEDETLSINVDVSEPPEGVVARALALPGLPSVELQVSGDGPLDAFAAELQLATDGQERLGGQATLVAIEGGRTFDLAIAGDIRPLLETDSRAFFGDETRLTARGQTGDAGDLILEELRLEADDLRLEGRASLDADRAPVLISLSGELGAGERTTLPGTEVSLAGADLTVEFDAATSEEWRAVIEAGEVVAAGFQVGALELDGVGILDPSASIPFAGRITALADGLSTPEDPALQAALGSRAEIAFDLSGEEGGVIRIADLAVATANLQATGNATATPVDGRVSLQADISASAPDLSPFSSLTGLDLTGLLEADVSADADLPGGAISLDLAGRSDGLSLGVQALEPLLNPESELSLAVQRDESGTRIEDFTLENSELTAEVSGDLNSEEGGLAINARLRELGLFTDAVAGPVSLDVVLEDAQGERAIEGQIETDFGFATSLQGALAGEAPSLQLLGSLREVERFVPQLNGAAQFDASLDLAPEFPMLQAALNANPGVRLLVNGPVSGPDQGFDIEALIDDLAAFGAPLPGPAGVTAKVSDLSNGPLIAAEATATPGITAQLSGRATGPDAELSVVASVADAGFLAPQLPGRIDLNATLTDPIEERLISARLESAVGLTAAVTGALSEESDTLDIDARLNSLNRFVPGLSGGANVTARVVNLLGTPAIEGQLTTDSGARADVNATFGLPNGAVQVAAGGSVPLSAVSDLLGDRSIQGDATFDLALRGQPVLSGLTGSLTTTDARLFDPTLGLTMSPISTNVSLSGGRATINGQAAIEGTPIRFNGGAGLAAPFPLEVSISTVRLPVNYTDILGSEVTADLSVTGSLQTQIAVAGAVRVEDVEIRIPDTGLGGATDIPPIRHEGAPSDVRQTLDRAGISLTGVEPGAGGGPLIPLDISVSTTTPIFVRGRGLDAGFSGDIRLTGTASAPVPIGRFGLTRGRLDFLGRRLDLDNESQITFAGSLLPSLDITSTAEVDDVTARIGLAGPVDSPELTLSSTPELPEDEILARVLFGRGIETLSAFQVGRLVNSLRKLSGEAGPGILEGTRAGLGVDDVDLRTDEATGETALAIGQTIDDGIYSEVEVESGGKTTIQLNLDLTDSTTLRGSASSDGETGVGVFWERDY